MKKVKSAPRDSSPEAILSRFSDRAHAKQNSLEEFIRAKDGDCESLVTLRSYGGTRNYPNTAILSNVPLMDLVVRELGKAVSRRLIDQPELDIGFVTFPLPELDTTIESTVVEFGKGKKRLRSTLNAMCENYVANVACFACDPLTPVNGGHLARHFGRAIIFGKEIKGRAEMATKKHGYQYSGAEGRSGIALRWLDRDRLDRDITTAATKMLPVPASLSQGDNDGDTALPYTPSVLAARCLEVNAQLKLAKVLISKGQGKAITAEVIEEAKAWLQKGKGDRHAAVHPDEVMHRFYDLWQMLGIAFRPALIKS